MAGFVQLDLFGDRPELDRPVYGASATPLPPEGLPDDDLIAAISNATLADVSAITAEAGKRRLMAAVPALISLCNRFVGYGASAVVPEQVAALDALAAIGGPEAAHAVSCLIVKRIVQGPTLLTAVTAASQLGVVLPNDAALRLLRDKDPSVRAAACGCVRAGHEIIAELVSMMGDPDTEVAIASACALGRMAYTEALRHLKRHLAERPSLRIVEGLARVADDEAIVFLARTGRARRELTNSVISALEEIESPKALSAADALRRFSRQTERHSQP
ncbi:MAG: HEAT repeat domain-containing protein [Roseiarcus sp.]